MPEPAVTTVAAAASEAAEALQKLLEAFAQAQAARPKVGGSLAFPTPQSGSGGPSGGSASASTAASLRSSGSTAVRSASSSTT